MALLETLSRRIIETAGIKILRVNRALDYINGDYSFRKSIDRIGGVDKAQQIQLMLRYQELACQGGPMPSFEDTEFRSFSQNGEDGNLLYIFALVGMTNRVCLEMCAGDGINCNSANLIVNHGFHGLLLDGQEKLIARGKQFYASLRETRLWPPKVECAWITRENVNDLVSNHGIEGEIDLFSLDMDGVDYWIWEALTVVKPRVVVVEFNNLWPPGVAVTVPYKEDFQADYTAVGCDYAGASLSAFIKLARSRSYRLVGAQRYGFNAYFVRNDLAVELLPEVKPESCVQHPFAQYAMSKRFENVKTREWVEI